MKRVRHIWNRLVYDVAPVAFGLMWMATIVSLSCGMAAWSIKWMLSVLGVDV